MQTLHTPHPILWPVIGMVLLTLITWLRLYFERIREIRKRRISPQRIASRRSAAEALELTRAADHFANLFEAPVLFYVLCMSLMVTGLELPVFLAGAWAYVALTRVACDHPSDLQPRTASLHGLCREFSRAVPDVGHVCVVAGDGVNESCALPMFRPNSKLSAKGERHEHNSQGNPGGKVSDDSLCNA